MCVSRYIYSSVKTQLRDLPSLAQLTGAVNRFNSRANLKRFVLHFQVFRSNIIPFSSSLRR